MPSFQKDDLRLFKLATSSGLRFLVAEFIDEHNMWSMGFFRFCGGRYELINLPEGFKPSQQLNGYLWELLETTENPPLAVPGGYYYNDGYHTIRSNAKDPTVLQGEAIENIKAPDGNQYTLIVSQQGSMRIAFIGLYAGTVHIDTPQECDLWRPTPVPQSLLNNTNEMLSIYGTADMIDATFMEFTTQIN